MTPKISVINTFQYTNADITGRPVYTSNDKRYFYFNSKRKQWLITSTYCQNPLNGSFWGYEFFDSTGQLSHVVTVY